MTTALTGVLLAVALSFAATGSVSPARAGVDFDIFINPGPGIYVVPGAGRISCREAAYQLHMRGYRRIGVIDCLGKSYTFEALRDRRLWLIKVSAYSGRIIDVRRA